MRIELLKHCAEDLDVVNAARVSLDKWHEAMELEDTPLIFYLMKNRHGSPFEHTYFQFRVEAPIFVFREWHRHRVGHSYNEMSGRYTQLEPIFYTPEEIRTQTGKQGAYTFEDFEGPEDVRKIMQETMDEAYTAYTEMLLMGVAKEQARAVLPVGIYSKMIWSCNARSLMHFCGLRNAPTALKEIRDLAVQAEDCLAWTMPVTHAAFTANERKTP